jgi:hypothetical protein
MIPVVKNPENEAKKSIIRQYPHLIDEVLKKMENGVSPQELVYNPALEPLPPKIQVLPSTIQALPSTIQALPVAPAPQQYDPYAFSKSQSGADPQLSGSIAPSYRALQPQDAYSASLENSPSLNKPPEKNDVTASRKSKEAIEMENKLRVILEQTISLLPENHQSNTLKESLTTLRNSLTQDHQSTEDESKLINLLTATKISISKYTEQLQDRSLGATAISETAPSSYVDIRGVLLEPSESKSASVISSTTSLGGEEVPLAIFSSAPTYEEIQKYENQNENQDSKSNCCLNTTSLYSNFTKFLSKISNKLSAPFSILNKGFNALRTRVSNQTQETKKDALDHPSTKKETPSPSTLPTSALQMVANAHVR